MALTDRPPGGGGMRAMVLAAGLGTRLGALSDERPKPLLPICDVPVIRFGLALLEAAGFVEVVINVHHRGGLIEQELGDRVGALAITYSREPVLLGTGGGLREAGDWLTRGGRDRFVALNGKLVVDVDLGRLVELDERAGQAAGRPPLATLLLREVPDPERWGAIETIDGRVLRLLGRGRAGSAGRTGMFTGVHVLGPEILERLPRGLPSHVVHDAYIPALEAGGHLAAVFYDGYFEEHSTPARYLDGNLALLRGAALLRHPPGPLTGCDESAVVAGSAILEPPYRIGPGARVGPGATVGPAAVVGRGASVDEGATLTEAVAWPGARVRGVVRRAIVTRGGVFPV